MTTTPVTVPSISTAYEIEILVGALIILGIVRGLNGRRYSPARVLRAPVVYVLFTFLAIFLSSTQNIYTQGMIIFLPLGLPIGIKFGKDVKFFQRGNVPYYKRSPYILLLWAFALIVRVSLEFFSFHSLLAVMVFNALLSFITGMLIGEAIHILKTEKNPASSATDSIVSLSGKE